MTQKSIYWKHLSLSAFFGILVIPSLFWYCMKPGQTVSAYVKDVNGSDPAVVFSQIKNSYDNNYPFKKDLIEIYHYLCVKLRITKPRHIQGNMINWYYFHKECPDFFGDNYFTNQEKKRIAEGLQSIQNRLAADGIQFHLMIAPNKMRIHPEHLPRLIFGKRSKITRCDDLIKYIAKNTNVSFYYPDKILLNNKKNDPLYYPNDTHWNMLGAFIAFSGFVKRLDPNLNVNTPAWIYRCVPFGDLGPSFDCAAPFPQGMTHTTTEDIQNCFHADYRERSFFNENAPSPRKIMICHDSFMISMEPYFHFYFKNVEQSVTFDLDKIRRKKPDIVIFEIVERNLHGLLNLPRG